MTISKNQILIIGSVITIVCLIVGYNKAYQAWNAAQSDIEALTAQSNELESQLVVKASELDASQAELTTLKEQYGIALSDKEQAEKNAKSSASEASKQKAAANEANENLGVCSSNVQALANVAGYLDQQKTYYRTAATYVAQAAGYYLDGYYEYGDQYLDYALSNMQAGNDLEYTIEYWLEQIQ